MNTHNLCFYGELMKIIPQLSSNAHLICSSVSYAFCCLHCDINRFSLDMAQKIMHFHDFSENFGLFRKFCV